MALLFFVHIFNVVTSELKNKSSNLFSNMKNNTVAIPI
jgi:hypothetical protein